MGKTIAVDFDGVLHDHSQHKFPSLGGRAIDGSRAALLRFKRKGYRIVIFSARATEEYRASVISWLDRNHLAYDEVTNIKPPAEYYIDDRAIRFESWPQTLAFIKENQDGR